jgi:glycosyltransferase involved in cell wall biosynthesis
MALGAPVVARDTPYNREVLGEDGTFVAPEADVIAAAVGALLVDRDRQASARRLSLRRAAGDFTWQSVLTRYTEALMSIMSTQKQE